MSPNLPAAVPYDDSPEEKPAQRLGEVASAMSPESFRWNMKPNEQEIT